MVLLFLFTLVPLQQWEARRRRDEAGDLAIAVRDDSQAVGKTLAALGRLGMQVTQATVVPGVGTSAVVRVQLARALRAGQATQRAKRLLTLRYVERVDTTLLELDTDGDVDQTRPEDGTGRPHERHRRAL